MGIQDSVKCSMWRPNFGWSKIPAAIQWKRATPGSQSQCSYPDQKTQRKDKPKTHVTYCCCIFVCVLLFLETNLSYSLVYFFGIVWIESLSKLNHISGCFLLPKVTSQVVFVTSKRFSHLDSISRGLGVPISVRFHLPGGPEAIERCRKAGSDTAGPGERERELSCQMHSG